MNKIVVAMDSMKGCLDSLSASLALADGVRCIFPEAEVVVVPVADGGEGTAEALVYEKKNFERISSRVKGPLGMPVDAEWYFDEKDGVAVIDMAAAAGLTLIAEADRDPLRATTYGVGELIIEAVGMGAKRILLGLGGSGTVDGGIGALAAMAGLEPEALTPKQTTHRETGSFKKTFGLVSLGDRDFHTGALEGVELMLLCDVEAPFTGERGAARVFGPQKGASAEDVEVLEERLEEIRKIVMERRGIDLNEVPGSGAAGGLAGGLMAFAGGRIVKGAAAVLDAIGFDDIISGADLIITGEGSSDRQTLMGKLPYEILQRGKRHNVPVWLVAGRVEDEDMLLEAGFERVICINTEEVLEISHTVGQNPMDPEVAKTRLSSILN